MRDRPVTKTFTLLHYTCRHFTSSHLNFTQLHFTPLNSFGLTPFKFLTAPLHLTSLHCTFRRFSPHFYSFQFIPFIIAHITLFLKILGLLGKVPNSSAGNWLKILWSYLQRNYYRCSTMKWAIIVDRPFVFKYHSS
jgi:hypothetical protein